MITDAPARELDYTCLTSKVRLYGLVCSVPDIVANELAESIDPVAKCNHDDAVDVYRAVLLVNNTSNDIFEQHNLPLRYIIMITDRG